MNARLIDMLLQLTSRERLLLGALVGVVMPLAIALGVLMPLAEARRNAAAELVETIALQAWISARASEMAGLDSSGQEGARGDGPIGASALEQSLISAGLRARLSAVDSREDGQISLRFDKVNFQDLMRWMSQQENRWGYDINTLRIRQTDAPGLAAVTLILDPGAI